MEYPFDDNTMTYDYAAHRYVLTPDFVQQELGVNLTETLNSVGDTDNSTIAIRALRRLSAHLYRQIYKFNSNNKNYVEFLLAKLPECREMIKECLVNELYYALRNGDYWYEKDTRGITLSADTLDRLNEPLSIGMRLTYRGYMPPRHSFLYHEGY